MGSLNPVFVTRAAVGRRETIIDGFARAFTIGGGQFCTKPKLLFVPAEAGFEEPLAAAVRRVAGSPLLNEQMTAIYEQVRSELAARPSMRTLVAGVSGKAGPSPTLLCSDIEQLLRHRDELLIECFGPTAMLVGYSSDRELLEVAAALPGLLTAAVHGGDEDNLAGHLISLPAERAARILWNSWPTGVSVTWAQHHGVRTLPQPAHHIPQ